MDITRPLVSEQSIRKGDKIRITTHVVREAPVESLDDACVTVIEEDGCRHSYGWNGDHTFEILERADDPSVLVTAAKQTWATGIACRIESGLIPPQMAGVYRCSRDVGHPGGHSYIVDGNDEQLWGWAESGFEPWQAVADALNCPVPISSIALMPDGVNHPPHYTKHPSGVECITITEHLKFCLGNAIKYIWRAGEKTNTSAVTDLAKARWYIDREITRINGGETLP